MLFVSGVGRSVRRASSGLPFLILFLIVQGLMNPVVAQGPQDFIVTFQGGTTPAGRALAVARNGATLRFNYGLVNAAAVRVPNANALAALGNDPSVLSIIPDRPVYAFQNANARGGNKPDKQPPGGGGGGQVTPEGVKRVGVPTDTSTGEGVGVAIADTGVELSNPDLNVVDAFSAFAGTSDDGDGHGTHVAGIVAGLDNEVDVIGVAPGATLYSVKVLNDQGQGSDSTIMAGADWIGANHNLVAPPIRVANLSLGRPGSLNDNPALLASFQALKDLDIVVVVSAGNESDTEVDQQVPATYPSVIAVASTTAADGSNRCRGFNGVIEADTASYFTTDGAFDAQTGIGVTISAPGANREDIQRNCFIRAVGILSLKLGGGTTRLFGTSMAAPHVAGIVARMIQRGDAGVENIRGILRATADRPGIGPLNSPSSTFTFDGEREGIAMAPQ